MSPGVGLQMDMGLLFYHKVPWRWEETQLSALSCVCVCVCVCVYERESETDRERGLDPRCPAQASGTLNPGFICII